MTASVLLIGFALFSSSPALAGKPPSQPQVDICKYNSKKHTFSLSSVTESSVAQLLASGSVLPGTWWPDADADAYGSASSAPVTCPPRLGYVANGGDCDDADALVNPGRAEVVFNGRDDDCDASTPDIVDRAPTIAVRAPTSGAVLLSGSAVTLQAEVSDPDTAPSTLKVTWTSSRDGLLGALYADASGTASIARSLLSAGTHTITMHVEDPDGLGADATVAFRIDSAPSAPQVAITPAAPGTDDALVASVLAPAVDPDGDPVALAWSWSADGVVQPGYTTASLPASATTRGQVWTVHASPADGWFTGTAGTASATIGNTAPVLGAVAITSSTTTVGDAVTCTATATDVDGDAPVVTYTWSNGATGASVILTASDDPGTTLTCLAAAQDGHGGVVQQATAIVVVDSAPVVDSVTIDPGEGRPGDVLTCSAVASDPDGDVPQLAYTWSNGSTTATTTIALGSAAGTLSCVAIAVDPDGLTALGSADAVVRPAQYAVGGTVTGLHTAGLVLRLDGSDDLTIAASGAFAFAAPVDDGSAYDVTVAVDPSPAGEACTVTDGSGTVQGGAVTSIGVACGPTVVIREFWAEEDRAFRGEDVTLGWSTRNATGCTVDGVEVTPTELGRISVPTDDTASFTLSCEGPGGPAVATITVPWAGDGAWSDVSGRCAIRDDGALYCWGKNSRDGVLGTGDTIAHPIPARVGTATWSQVDADAEFACGVRTDGSLWCWGENGWHQLGLADTTPRLVPTRVDSSLGWVSVATATTSACGVRAGRLYCWGLQERAGIGSTDHPVTTPTQRDTATDWVSVSGGGSHYCGLRSTGVLYCWGYNGSAQLGRPAFPSTSTTPWPVATDTDWATIATGPASTCAVKTDGRLFCSGNGDFGLLDGTDTSIRQGMTQIGTSSDWAQVHIGRSTCARDIGGTLTCAGTNKYGEIGTGSFSDGPVGTVGGDETWSDVSSSDLETCGITTAGRLACWGFLTLPGGTASPTRVGTDTDWTDLDLGVEATTFLIKEDGRLFFAGTNVNGISATGSSDYGYAPREVLGGARWLAVSTGSVHACGLQTTGALACWGANGSGELGDGTTTTATEPVLVVGGTTDQAALAAGPTHTCAVLEDGVLACWGAGGGKLGNGDLLSRHTPTPVAGDREWVGVGVGSYHSCGIDADGGLWCWGSNVLGALGIGTTTDALVPTQVGADDDWLDVDGGWYHTCALKEDGRIFCWGRASEGQLGDGDPSTRTTPIQVGTDADWVDVDAGRDGSCGRKADGTLWCWGSLGLGDPTMLPPTQVGTERSWVDISLGNGACGIRDGGRAFCWGTDGAATKTNVRPAPVVMFDPID